MSKWSWVPCYFLFLKTEFIITGYELPKNIVYRNSKILEIFLPKCNIPITDPVPHSSYSRKGDFMYLSEEKRDYKMFKKWFDVICSDMTWDYGDGDIEHDDN